MELEEILAPFLQTIVAFIRLSDVRAASIADPTLELPAVLLQHQEHAKYGRGLEYSSEVK